MSKQPDLRQLTFDFLQNLPTTIRGHILAFVTVFAAHTMPPMGRDDLEIIREKLIDSNELIGFGMLLCTIAVIDHMSTDWGANKTLREAAAKKMSEIDPTFEKIALQIPLQSRHFEKALVDWRSLRTTVLTAENLHDFENTLLGFRPKK